MALPTLPPAKALRRLQTLDSIQLAAVHMRRDFESDFTMHLVEGSAEIAIRPANFVEGDYLRAYLAPVNPNQMNLILDDVIFDADVVDLTEEVFWDVTAGTWDLRKIDSGGD